MHYKAPDNSPHYLDDDSFSYLLPAGSVQITDEEAAAIREQNQPVPQSVTMRQARLALLQANKLHLVNAAVDSMQGAEGDAARIEWNYSNEVRRNQPITLLLAQTIGVSEQEMDQLFITAATL